jgi:hypothetical protein
MTNTCRDQSTNSAPVCGQSATEGAIRMRACLFLKEIYELV